MRDPHVVSIRYRIEALPGFNFGNPPPLEFEQDDFSARLDKGELVCHMKVHFATAGEAKAAVEPFLRGWELDAALRRGVPEFAFSFVNAEVVDRAPPDPNGSKVILAEAADVFVFSDEATLEITRNNYPPPPTDFRVSPNVETLWQRFLGFRNGTEPVQSMAYFCLTVVEGLAGGRANAATQFRVDRDVLDLLGELTSTRGDLATARKANPAAPLTNADREWIAAVVCRLIRRIGELEAGASVTQIGLVDLPKRS